MVRKIVLLLIAVFGWGMLFAQKQQVSGLVTGSEGEPIIGATILVEGTSVGTTTNAEGMFDIRAGRKDALVISYIGYHTMRVEVGEQTYLKVSLKEDTQAIEDVVVVAFGTAKKEAFTGSAVVVKADDIAKVQNTSVTRALEGKVAGVQMTTASGDLGAKPQLVIRGFSSISAGTDPLIVVDGVPYPGDLNNINTQDIESMTVLKDAASNALYGARGANGVIMITTKKAKSRDAVVNVDAKWGVNSRAMRTYETLSSPAQYYESYYGALYNYYVDKEKLSPDQAYIKANNMVVGPAMSGGLAYQVYTVPQGEMFIGQNGKVNPNATLGRLVNYGGQDYWLRPDDWLDETYKSSLRQEYNISVSGRSDRSSFSASFGYLNNQGIIEGSDMERYTGRLRADFQAKKWLKVGANFGYANFKWNNGNGDEGNGSSTGNIFAFSTYMAPIYPVYIRDGKGNIMVDKYGMKMYDYGDKGNAGLSRPIQPSANALQTSWLDKSLSEGNAINGTAFADFQLYKDLKLTVNVGFGLDETRSIQRRNAMYGQFAIDGGLLSVHHNRSTYLNLQQLINYTKNFGEHHHFEAMLGHEYYKSQGYTLGGSKAMLWTPNADELDAAVVDKQQVGSNRSKYNNEGYFGRVQYDYDNRIFLSGSYRRDASSRFHPDHRWGNFWSVGGAWVINHENWFNAKWVDLLKLKFSIGSQGNDNIGDYLYTDTYSIQNNDGELALVAGHHGNPNITWETNTNMNAGFEFGLFGNRLTGSMEYFYRKTTDMLFFFPVPLSLGYSGYFDNVGDMRNSGFEMELHAGLIRTKNFSWDFDFNLTHFKNKVTMLPDAKKTMTVQGYSGFATGSSFLGENLPLNTFYMPQYAGINHENGLPMWYRNKLDKDGNVVGRETTEEYQEATDYLCGNPTPSVYGGFGTSFSFYGVDISASFTYQIGGLTYDSGYASFVGAPTSGGSNVHKDVLNAWTPENPNSNIPRYQFNDKNINAMSDRFLVDASYLSFQNLQVGYTLPVNFTRKFKVERMRIYLACDNVFYWSYRRGLDPRQSLSGTTNSSMYSPIRTISGGVNVTF